MALLNSLAFAPRRSLSIATADKKPAPRYKVLLLNDSVHYHAQVVRVLTRVFTDMTVREAVEKTDVAHETGSSVLRVCDQSQAETYCEALRIHTLKSIVEPVE
jgi:ATP-dependent Clp protease adaptor protein ClpS